MKVRRRPFIKVMRYKVLELYSGIGGMHYAFEGSGISYEVIAAVDINTSANTVYRYNFPDNNLLQRNIQSMTLDELKAWNPDILTMSPPCQPFTRQGKKQDCKDLRTESFQHVLQLLKNFQPSFILLENVFGFETSEARTKLLEVLNFHDYVIQEYLLSPAQFNIPNSRLRYYLLAKLSMEPFCSPSPAKMLFSTLETCLSCIDTNASITDLVVGSYLEENVSEKYLVPDKVLSRFAHIFDIVDKNSSTSCCFTRGYTHYVEGTGSVLHQNVNIQVSEIFKNIPKNSECGDQSSLDLLHQLELRYFTPREIGNIMGFPPEPVFRFPEQTTDRQRYRLLGNSVNIKVIQKLLRKLICPNKFVEQSPT